MANKNRVIVVQVVESNGVEVAKMKSNEVVDARGETRCWLINEHRATCTDDAFNELVRTAKIADI